LLVGDLVESTVVAVVSGLVQSWTAGQLDGRRTIPSVSADGIPGMREELRGLHERAGQPSKSALKRHADRAMHNVAESTLIGVLSHRGRPRWATVEAFIDGCLGYAKTRRNNTLRDTDHAKIRWRALYDQAYPGARASGETSDGLVETYLARLRDRYGHLDIETLLPLDSQEERIPIGVREVFVPQTARADPPPIELPRELWQRLSESGAVEARELPENLDREVLARVRQSYEARPARPVLGNRPWLGT
jgi:hypothetical protein